MLRFNKSSTAFRILDLTGKIDEEYERPIDEFAMIQYKSINASMRMKDSLFDIDNYIVAIIFVCGREMTEYICSLLVDKRDTYHKVYVYAMCMFAGREDMIEYVRLRVPDASRFIHAARDAYELYKTATPHGIERNIMYEDNMNLDMIQRKYNAFFGKGYTGMMTFKCMRDLDTYIYDDIVEYEDQVDKIPSEMVDMMDEWNLDYMYKALCIGEYVNSWSTCDSIDRCICIVLKAACIQYSPVNSYMNKVSLEEVSIPLDYARPHDDSMLDECKRYASQIGSSMFMRHVIAHSRDRTRYI